MKRIFKIISSAVIICLIPFSMVAGQEKKSEQKIKIIVDDGSGTKVIIDTLLKDSPMADSIRLKDGKVIYINNSGDDVVLRPHEGTERIFVTVSSDGKSQGEKVIVINDGKVIEKEGGETFTYTIKSDNKEKDVEKTKYVIAKDGMVITIEGNDYAKVKELVKEIENKLGVK